MTETVPTAKLKPNQVAVAGEHYVAAAIHRRGGYAVTFKSKPLIHSGNCRSLRFPDWLSGNGWRRVSNDC